MTIKEFAKICGCNSQTLRYYDAMGLLKPKTVDRYSGYRYYDEKQALEYVKIKNLQEAGFSLEEIKELLKKDDDSIYKAFEEKIKEQQDKLERIKSIQKSYCNELKEMENKLKELKKQVVDEMENYNPTEEFGISQDKYQNIVERVQEFFDDIIDSGDDSRIITSEEKIDREFFLDNPKHIKLYEKHDWSNVKDFISEIPNLEEGKDYVLYIEVNKDKISSAFASTMVNLLLKDNQNKGSIACTVEESTDSNNHFWLFESKE
ncbi:MAG: MerR family transcriptional regulator [Erysipelotrichaceae bacterium]|jgi:DNA-binding transcriptional MerR regulator